MTEKTLFVKADGTLLIGKDAKQELARHDAEKMLKELGLKGDNTVSSKAGLAPEGKENFKGKGHRLKSAAGPRTASTEDPSISGPSGQTAIQGGGVLPEPRGPDASRDSHGGSRPSKITDEAHEREIHRKIADVGPQIEKDAQAIWTFSKGVEDGVYHFSLDMDTLWKKTFGIMDLVQSKLNEVASKATSYIDKASAMTDSARNAVEMWGDMNLNVRKGAERLNNKIKEKTDEVTGYTKNLNDRAQSLAKSATSTLNSPYLKNVVDMTEVSDTLGEMAGTGEYLTSSINSFVNDQSDQLQEFINSFSQMVIDFLESSGISGFIKEAASEISKLLKKLSEILALVRERINAFLNIMNGFFEKIFTWLAKIRSVIEGVLGLDIGLMKEALKNGTIRLSDVRVGNVTAAFDTEVHTKSSADISAAKVTAGNVSAAVRVRDNSKSGHIEAAVVDVKAGNVDAAVLREGKFKRNLAYLKGAGVNAGNVRATVVDNREGDTAVVGAAAAEVNIGNVEAFGLGRKGTHRHTTVQPSLNVGNVAIGCRRSTGTNLKFGPQLAAFNVDLTVGPPSLNNFLNQLAPGQGFGNIAIPFFGGGGGEAGGKSSGEKDCGMPLETTGESTYGLARDTVEFGDRLPQGSVEVRGTGTEQGTGSNTESGAGLRTGHNTGNEQQCENQTKADLQPNDGRSGGGRTGSDSCDTQNTYRDSHTDHVRSDDDGKRANEFNNRHESSTGGGDVGKPSSGFGNFGVAGSHSGSNFDNMFSNLKEYGNGDRNRKGEHQRPDGKLFGSSYDGPSSHKADQATDFHGNGSQSQSHKRGDTYQKRPPSTGNHNQDNSNSALGSGVYRSGDGLEEKTEDDYQTKLVSLVKGQVQKKVGKKKADTEKKREKPDEKPKKLDKEELKRQLLKECRDDLEQAGVSGETSLKAGKDEDTTQKKSKAKAKAKPWGEHGNIHGFSTLGMDSDKEVKKLGDGIYGFGDG